MMKSLVLAKKRLDGVWLHPGLIGLAVKQTPTSLMRTSSDSGIPPCGSVCVRKRKKEAKGGVEKHGERGRKIEGTETVVMLMQCH